MEAGDSASIGAVSSASGRPALLERTSVEGGLPAGSIGTGSGSGGSGLGLRGAGRGGAGAVPAAGGETRHLGKQADAQGGAGRHAQCSPEGRAFPERDDLGRGAVGAYPLHHAGDELGRGIALTQLDEGPLQLLQLPGGGPAGRALFQVGVQLPLLFRGQGAVKTQADQVQRTFTA